MRHFLNIFLLSTTFIAFLCGIGYGERDCTKAITISAPDNYPLVIHDSQLAWIENPKTLNRYLRIHPRYRDHHQFLLLAFDPAHRAVTPHSLREAMVGIEAVYQGIVQGPLRRGPKEIEFFDARGNGWDVKSPRSPERDETWEFDPNVAAQSIVQKFASVSFVSILLDVSRLKEPHRKALWDALNYGLNPGQFVRVHEVRLPSFPHAHWPGPLVSSRHTGWVLRIIGFPVRLGREQRKLDTVPSSAVKDSWPPCDNYFFVQFFTRPLSIFCAPHHAAWRYSHKHPYASFFRPFAPDHPRFKKH